jgi:hypothetical protein
MPVSTSSPLIRGVIRLEVYIGSRNFIAQPGVGGQYPISHLNLLLILCAGRALCDPKDAGKTLDFLEAEPLPGVISFRLKWD